MYGKSNPISNGLPVFALDDAHTSKERQVFLRLENTETPNPQPPTPAKHGPTVCLADTELSSSIPAIAINMSNLRNFLQVYEGKDFESS